MSRYKNIRKSIHSQEQTALRTLLKEKRESLGLTQRELADETGLIYSFIGKVEIGERRLDFLEMIDYCRMLQIDPHDVVRMIEGMNSKK